MKEPLQNTQNTQKIDPIILKFGQMLEKQLRKTLNKIAKLQNKYSELRLAEKTLDREYTKFLEKYGHYKTGDGKWKAPNLETNQTELS